MAKKRMSKKELKEPDEILTFLGRTTEFIAKNRVKLIIVSLAIVLGAASTFAYRAYNHKKEMKENAMLWSILGKIPESRLTYDQDELKRLAIAKTDLESLVKGASSTSVLLYAHYYMGNIDTRLGYYSDSVDNFKKVLLMEGVAIEMKYLCNLGLAYSYESLTDYEKALSTFEEAAKFALDTFNKAAAIYGMARSYELLGRSEKARQAYSEIIEKYPEYPDIQFIRVRLSSIS